ncbi:hypothetical protein IEQ34_006870 [Dendrobium chrysotoxum]|uniref:Uncharacterized protein n=1 Tax=Dendrobium chrysotoxum TaxID=161865 RepID=A0AAV7GRL4_DENCH|nr:hypothetical protein IEQ34_006870 [Dendrobium chrysotoxum]
MPPMIQAGAVLGAGVVGRTKRRERLQSRRNTKLSGAHVLRTLGEQGEEGLAIASFTFANLQGNNSVVLFLMTKQKSQFMCFPSLTSNFESLHPQLIAFSTARVFSRNFLVESELHILWMKILFEIVFLLLCFLGYNYSFYLSLFFHCFLTNFRIRNLLSIPAFKIIIFCITILQSNI